jgi:preprotein translocase subunit SecA
MFERPTVPMIPDGLFSLVGVFHHFLPQAMKFLQQAVGLRGYAQREPLAEYKLEGYALFVEMMAKIRRNVIYNVYLFHPSLVQRKQTAAVKA